MYVDEKKFGEVELVVDKVGEILLAAADYMELHPWVKDSFEKNGGVCIWGAINKVGGTHTPGIVTRINKYTGCGIVVFNDCIAENKQEVIDMLRKAALNG
jgi:hypothetical protein